MSLYREMNKFARKMEEVRSASKSRKKTFYWKRKEELEIRGIELTLSTIERLQTPIEKISFRTSGKGRKKAEQETKFLYTFLTLSNRNVIEILTRAVYTQKQLTSEDMYSMLLSLEKAVKTAMNK